MPRAVWYATPRSKLALLAIDGKRVTKVGEAEVGEADVGGRLAEGAASARTADTCTWATSGCVGLSFLRVEGRSVRDTGERLRLPGRPASLGIARP